MKKFNSDFEIENLKIVKSKLIINLTIAFPSNAFSIFIFENHIKRDLVFNFIIDSFNSNSKNLKFFGNYPFEIKLKNSNLYFIGQKSGLYNFFNLIQLEEYLKKKYANWNSLAFYEMISSLKLKPYDKISSLKNWQKFLIETAIIFSSQTKAALIHTNDFINDISFVFFEDYIKFCRQNYNCSFIFFDYKRDSKLLKIIDYIVLEKNGNIVCSDFHRNILNDFLKVEILNIDESTKKLLETKGRLKIIGNILYFIGKISLDKLFELLKQNNENVLVYKKEISLDEIIEFYYK